MSDTRAILLIAVCAAVTAVLRFLPFAVFGRGKKTPAYITYLSSVLPFAIMGMLVIYCLRNVSLGEKPYGLPDLLSCGAVVGLHLWKKNTLLSIAAGTVLYMVLVQAVF